MEKYVNMREWAKAMMEDPKKRPLPVLTFPAGKLLGVSTKELLLDPENQAEGMKAITDRYDMPAALAYMDLSVEAEAFGAHCVYSENEIPTIIGQLIEDEDDAEALELPKAGAGRIDTVHEGIKKAKELITDRPLFAECIGPFSLAGRLMDVNEVMVSCYTDPDVVHAVLEKVTGFLIGNMKRFKEDGAQGVIMAEPLAGLLSPGLAKEFSSDYVAKIVDEIQDDDFLIFYHNCGDNTPLQAADIYSTGCAGYHFGNSIDLEDMLKTSPEDAFVMGNLASAEILTNASAEVVKEETKKLLEKCSRYKNFWLSSSCDVPPNAPVENIDAFFEAFEEYIEG